MSSISELLEDWPDESSEAAQLVMQKYGEPDEYTPSQFVWHRLAPGSYRRKLPTPYMEGLRFEPQTEAARDPDQRVLSEDDLTAAAQEGQRRGGR